MGKASATGEAAEGERARGAANEVTFVAEDIRARIIAAARGILLDSAKAGGGGGGSGGAATAAATTAAAAAAAARPAREREAGDLCAICMGELAGPGPDEEEGGSAAGSAVAHWACPSCGGELHSACAVAAFAAGRKVAGFASCPLCRARVDEARGGNAGNAGGAGGAAAPTFAELAAGAPAGITAARHRVTPASAAAVGAERVAG
jgi:hypothetical protein